MAEEYNPDWLSPPGDTIQDLLDERGLSQQHLAERLGWSIKEVDRLIWGLVPLDGKTASDLAQFLGPTKEFWLRREQAYRRRQERDRDAINSIVARVQERALYQLRRFKADEEGLIRMSAEQLGLSIEDLGRQCRLCKVDPLELAGLGMKECTSLYCQGEHKWTIKQYSNGDIVWQFEDPYPLRKEEQCDS